MADKKILVIDDNPVIIRMNESLLSSQGYDVISAVNGLEGLEKARQEKPDIIFLDIILPEMHGFEVCKKLKSEEATKDIPIIIMTGSGLEDVARDEPDIQADGYVTKPYTLENLEEAIRKATGKC